MEMRIEAGSIQAFQEAYASDPKNALAMNAVTRNGIGPVAIRLAPDRDPRGHQPEGQRAMLAVRGHEQAAPARHGAHGAREL